MGRPSSAGLRIVAADSLYAARCREGGAALAMLVPEAEQDWPPRSPPAGASHDTLLDHAWSGSRGVDAVVAGLVLAASRPSVSAPSDDRTDPSPMRSVRACGDVEGRGDTRARALLCAELEHEPAVMLASFQLTSAPKRQRGIASRRSRYGTISLVSDLASAALASPS